MALLDRVRSYTRYRVGGDEQFARRRAILPVKNTRYGDWNLQAPWERSEFVSRMPPQEMRRRLCHMLPGLLAFILPIVPHAHPLTQETLFRMALLATVITGGVIVLFCKIERPNETNWLLNIVSYPGAIIGTLLLFPGNPEFALVVLVVLAFGDGSATLFGLLAGRRRLPWNKKKTWVGSAAFLLFAAPLAGMAYWEESSMEVSASVALGIGVSTAVLAGIAESLPMRISDNLRVGFAAMVGVVVAHAGLIGWP